MRPRALSLLILVITGLVLGLLISGLPPRVTISILGGVFIFCLTLFYPALIVAILLCVPPFNILWMGVGITPLEIIYGLTYVLLGISWILKGNKTKGLFSPMQIPLIVFFCVTILACIIGILRGHRFQHWGSDLNAVMYYGLCFMMPDMIKDNKQLHRLFLLIIISTIPALLMKMEGISGILLGLKITSVLALVMFIISVAMALILPKGRKKAVFFALSLFFGIMQLLSFARSIWIGAVFGLAFLFLISLGRQKINFLKFILAGILSASLYLSVAMSVPADNPLFKSIYALEKRYESIFTAKEEPSIITRGSEWREAKRMALEHPFFGNGLGTQITYFRYDIWFGAQTWETTRYIHNAYLFLFLNMGILGLASFLWFAASFIKYGIAVYRFLEDGIDKAIALGVVSSFASLMVVSLAGPFLTSPLLTMWLGFFMGALIIIDRSLKRAS